MRCHFPLLVLVLSLAGCPADAPSGVLPLPDTGRDGVTDQWLADVPDLATTELLDLRPDQLPDGSDTLTDLPVDSDLPDGADLPDLSLPLPGFELAWARSVGGSGWDVVMGVAAAMDGGLFLGLHGNSKLVGLDGTDNAEVPQGASDSGISLVRLNEDGSVLFNRGIGGTADDRVRGVATTLGGDHLAAGLYWSDELPLGDFVLPNAGKMDAWLARLGPSGEFLWAHAAAGPLDEVYLTVAAHPEDDGVVAAGYFGSEKLLWDGVAVSSVSEAESYDALLVKLSADGDVQWAQAAGGNAADYIHGVAVDDSGRIYVAGAFYSNSLQVGDHSHPGIGGADIWIACYSPAGDVLWSRGFGGIEHDASHAITALPGGGAVVVGSFQSPAVDFGTGPLVHAGLPDYHDIFVVHLDVSGEVVWSRAYGGTASDVGKTISVGPDGTLFLAGSFDSPALDFGGGPLGPAGTAQTRMEAFVAALSPDGDFRWSRHFGGLENDIGYGVAATQDGFFFGGSFNGAESTPQPGSIDFGAGPLFTPGSRDGFVTRFVPAA